MNDKRSSERDETISVESMIKPTAAPESIIFDDKEDFTSESTEESALILPKLLPKSVELSVRIEARDDLSGVAIFSKEDAIKLSLKENDYVELYDSAVGKSGIIKTRIDDDLSIGWILIDQNMYNVYKFESESLKVKISHQEPLTADKVTLSISALTGDVFDLVNEFRDDSNSLKEFLKDYVIRKGLILKWKEKNAKIKVTEILPEITDEEAIIFDFNKPRVLAIIPEGGIEFNAILLMDISKSMIARDLEVINVQPIIDEMRQVFRSVKVDAFLKEFKEGHYVKRRSGAAFAGLLFLKEKVKRGLDETIGVITFAEEAEVLKFDYKPFINSKVMSKGAADRFADIIIDNVEDKSGVSTNMAGAIEKCLNVTKHLPILKRRNPLLVILLTDGFDTSKRVKEAVETTLAGKNNVVLYSVGIGPYVNKRELQEISALCCGEVFLPENLEELSEWYQNIARDLAIRLVEND
ncbi:MAG: vWA domain-containing protein [Candidatus Heimdallarchaeota archaeon]